MEYNIPELIARYEALASARDGYWLHLWREVRKYVYPSRQDNLPKGKQTSVDIFDTTAIAARYRLAAGIYNWMSPPDKRWFELAPQDDKLAEVDEVKSYFAEVTREIQLAMANSNWATRLIEVLNELAAGMDGILYVEDGGVDSVLNFRCLQVEHVCYCEDARGNVDTVFEQLEMSARQLLLEFGDSCPEKVKAQATDPKQLDGQHKVLHVVLPRSQRNEFSKQALDMPFADLYIHCETKTLLREGGYSEIPYAVCHFHKSPGEQYGRGPGVDGLADIKMLNRYRQAYIVSREYAANPGLLVPDGTLVNNEYDHSPGATNVIKPTLNNSKPELVLRPNTAANDYTDIENERLRIRTEIFFADIFDPLGDLKQITATEAEIRNAAKMVPFAPIAGNLHDKLFRPIINRVYSILMRRGMLPELPAALAEEADYKVEFVSKIALSIKNIETLAWLQAKATIMEDAQVKPEVLDNFDFDYLDRNIALNHGVDPRGLVPINKRDELRKKREAAQLQAAEMEQLVAGAGALGSNAAKAPEAGSPLDLVMNGGAV